MRLVFSSIFFLIFQVFIIQNSLVEAQTLDSRVQALEDYVETFQPTLIELTENLQNAMRAVKEESLSGSQQIADQILIQVENQLQELNTKKINLDVSSQAFQSIQTNTGLLLVSVEGLRDGVDGLQLILNIGNSNYADFQGFKIRLVWGSPYYPTVSDYKTWRQGLKGAEYTFDGTLEKGLWNQVVVDLDTSDTSDLKYLECEIEILSVQLQSS